MRELIKKYQETGQDREILELLLNYVDEDLITLKYNDNAPEVQDGLKYVAYRIRAFMMKNCFAKRNARNLTERSNQSDDFEGLKEFLDCLYEADWIELDWRTLHNYDFSSIYNNESQVRDYLGATQYDFFNLLNKFVGLGQNSDEFKIDFKQTKDNLLPLFEEAFLYAIKKVDCERETKEIVKYINKAMLTKFIELQMQRDNVKRIRKGNKSTYVKVETKAEETDIWMMMFGKTLKHVGGLEAFSLWLTPKQIKFVQDVYNIIEKDLKENNTNAFRWKEDGTPVLKKRHLAEQIDMNETNFKQTLKRCEKKIFDNWKEVISNRF
ncbi:MULTISPECIES: hypothetical protein [Bacillus]|uniref:Uncharacterized protein n=1 Tax=Bacillus cereus TaxID=1396 RepID=A0A9X5VAU7_BACCE|nr:hypothetical protein [Bacillus cereus]AQQ64333.1 hypothetical Protein FORC21_3538 [Bacillus cereus]OBZ61977.1 hypothetical protein ABH62_15400 [Bacillus cereus]OJS95044.1 hypothetical protein BKK64_14905 [Bacillus cereus]ULX58865.1 hypothetical protein JN158_17640 [Bacillus cereus]SMD94211.1 hypothetical protein BACERE00196_02327 [Bacillus cereus]